MVTEFEQEMKKKERKQPHPTMQGMTMGEVEDLEKIALVQERDALKKQAREAANGPPVFREDEEALDELDGIFRVDRKKPLRSGHVND